MWVCGRVSVRASICLRFIQEHSSFGHPFGHTGAPEFYPYRRTAHTGEMVVTHTAHTAVWVFLESTHTPAGMGIPNPLNPSQTLPIPRRYGHTEPSQPLSNPLRPYPYRPYRERTRTAVWVVWVTTLSPVWAVWRYGQSVETPVWVAVWAL